MATKFQIIFNEMVEKNQQLFASFKVLHDSYAKDKIKWQREFNENGEIVCDVIRKYEAILCSKSDSGSYSKFSSNLSERFWQEVRAHFPLIDFVGVS